MNCAIKLPRDARRLALCRFRNASIVLPVLLSFDQRYTLPRPAQRFARQTEWPDLTRPGQVRVARESSRAAGADLAAARRGAIHRLAAPSNGRGLVTMSARIFQPLIARLTEWRAVRVVLEKRGALRPLKGDTRDNSNVGKGEADG